MPKQYDLVIAPGRFEPLHLGHIANGKHALDIADNVLFIVGSDNQPRTIKNPFNTQERITFILGEFPLQNVHARGVEDFIYSDNRWIQEVQHAVKEHCELIGLDPKIAKIAIMGHEKDESSYYLRSFAWDFVPTVGYTKVGAQIINATKIRELMFEGHLSFIESVVGEFTYKLMLQLVKEDWFADLVEEYNFIKGYKKQAEAYPYPLTFNTADAVVVQSGHVLLIKRKSAPGKGLWALPGGFLQAVTTMGSDGFLTSNAETFRSACLRELREETRIKVPRPILDANITYQHCFDHPDRSLRGRTITQAFLIELLGDVNGLPKVKGSDDAAVAKWFTFDEIKDMSSVLFEDHFSIIQHMLARAK